MKDVAKKLASTSINEEDKAPADVPLENSPMETDKSLLGENTSTPKTFRHRVNGEWIQVPKMGGAMTKRYLRYIKEGMSKEEAYEKAKVPLGPAEATPKFKEGNLKQVEKRQEDRAASTSKGNPSSSNKPKPGQKGQKKEDAIKPGPSKESRKRPRQNNSSSVAETKRKRDETGEIPPQGNPRKKPLFSEVAGSVKIGLVPLEYPKVKMTKDDPEKAMEVLKKLICEQKTGTIKPVFACRPFLRNGFLVLICSNKETAEWTKQQQTALCSMGVTVVEEDYFPDKSTLTGYFRGAMEDSNDTILELVEGQNACLEASKWCVVNRRNTNEHAVLTLLVNQESLVVLKQNKFLVNFGFGLKVKFHQGRQEPPKEEAAASSEGMDQAGAAEGGANPLQ